MASRPSWSGFLKFNLISVPVQGYNAAAPGGGKIGFHLLHAKCHERIRYKKVCPIHGEVENDEIVSAYEVEKGKYVEVPKGERQELREEDDKTIGVEAFVHPDSIDPAFFSGRTFFLVPDGKVAQKPYVVMLDAMHEQNRFAVARVVFAGRAQIAVVHPSEGILAMTLLLFDSELKKPSAFEKDVEQASASPQERQLAETLIEAATAKSFDLAHYKDSFHARLAKLVETKARKVKRSPAKNKDEPGIINLMDALRKSLEETKHSPVRTARRKAAPHPSKKASGRPKRKTR